MSEKSKEELKREAAARAKEVAQRKLAERQAMQEEIAKALPNNKEETEQSASEHQPVEDVAEAKKRAAAEAKAKALELAKQRAAEKAASTAKDEDPAEAKKRAAAEAKAKALELAKQREAEKVASTAEVSEDPAEAKKRAAAEAKAKALELAKQRAAEKAASTAEGEDPAEAKKRAAAEAKAKALELTKQRAAEKTEAAPADEKAKAIAAAKAKAAAAAKAKLAAQADGAVPADEKAKAIAAAKAKAAAAAAARKKVDTTEKPAAPVEQAPSVNQLYLDKYVAVLTKHLGEAALEDFYINRLSKDVPTLVLHREHYYKAMEFLKYNEQLAFNYVSELHATDFVTHMEVYVHLCSYKNKQSVAVKVKLDRDEPRVASVATLWKGADWPEREAYDLLGVIFKGHPNLKRILLPDDWIGYPLRKDYEPFDVEV